MKRLTFLNSFSLNAAVIAWCCSICGLRAASYQVGPTRSFHSVGSLPQLSPRAVFQVEAHHTTLENLKCRAHYTELLYNYIADSQDGEVGLVDASETAAANSRALMLGNIVISKPRLSGYNSGRFIQFGQDSGGQHNGTLFAFNNTFVAGDGRVQFLSANATGAHIVAVNNILYGSDKLVGSLGGGVSGSVCFSSRSPRVTSRLIAV